MKFSLTLIISVDKFFNCNVDKNNNRTQQSASLDMKTRENYRGLFGYFVENRCSKLQSA